MYIQSQERGVDMSITADIIRGHTNTIILSHLINSDSYGYEINKDILTRTDNRYELKEATLYTAFKRLEDAGFIVSYWGDEGAGARRKYYSITQSGKREYYRLVEEWEEEKSLINRLLEEKR